MGPWKSPKRPNSFEATFSDNEALAAWTLKEQIGSPKHSRDIGREQVFQNFITGRTTASPTSPSNYSPNRFSALREPPSWTELKKNLRYGRSGGRTALSVISPEKAPKMLGEETSKLVHYGRSTWATAAGDMSSSLKMELAKPKNPPPLAKYTLRKTDLSPMRTNNTGFGGFRPRQMAW